MIATLAGSGQSEEWLDFNANRLNAVNPSLKHYKIIHFATHALVDNVHPQLSGLVLSLVGSDGKPEDGFLRLLDIYNMELNADLVVLSACKTALGRQLAGEGLIGLSRGFMYAGASRVMASLWNVDDEATAKLMERFYQGLLRNHETPSQALRSAQLWMLGQKRWHSPYYWAGFVLQGDWR